MQKRAITKVLVIGRGEMHDGEYKTLDCEEIQSCIAILEEECQAVLLTNAGSEPMMEAILDVPIYQLPLSSSYIDEVVQRENPDAVFAPFVESTGWRLMKRLNREGYWKENEIHVIDDSYVKGNSIDANRAIRKAIATASLRQCRQVGVSSLEEAQTIPETIGGFPVAIRSANKGRTVVDSPDTFRYQLSLHLAERSGDKVFIEEYLSGWKEIFVAVLKDAEEEVAVIHTSEKMWPIGVNSSKDISVSPIQTLQKSQVRFVTGAAVQLAKALSKFIGYAAIRFAIDPDSKRFLVAGVDFSTDHSADVSLMSGYPLMKTVTKLALGCSLNDLDISSVRFQNREDTERMLLMVPGYRVATIMDDGGRRNQHSKVVSDKIYAGKNFCEAYRKAWHAENGNAMLFEKDKINLIALHEDTKYSWHQMNRIYRALAAGSSVSEIANVTGIDPWFLQKIQLVVETERQLLSESLSSISEEQWVNLKRVGFSDAHIAKILNQNVGEQVSDSMVRSQREFFNAYPSTVCFGCSSGDFIKPNNKIMILTGMGDAKDSSLPQVPSFVLAKEASQMGFDVVSVTNNISALPFWMMFAGHIYIEELNWEIVYEIYRRENPSGIFIESYDSMTELEKQFIKVGAPIVKVPFEITNQMRNSA